MTTTLDGSRASSSSQSPFSHCWNNVRRFDGRDPRPVFWSYAALVSLLTTLMAMMVFGGATLVAIYRPDGSSLWPFAIVAAVLLASFVGLLAAAVSRRLHDTNRSARWGLLPLPFLLISSVGTGWVVSEVASQQLGPGPVLVVFASNVGWLATITVLVALLAQPGTSRSNRFGPGPPGPSKLTQAKRLWGLIS